MLFRMYINNVFFNIKVLYIILLYYICNTKQNKTKQNKWM